MAKNDAFYVGNDLCRQFSFLEGNSIRYVYYISMQSLLCMHDLLDSLAIGNKELTLNKQVGAFA